MGRLTYLKEGRPCVRVNGAEITGPVAERLHAYEETGYEPGEVHDLADRIGKFHLDRGRQNLEAAHDALNRKERDELEHDTYGPLHKKIGTWMKADAEDRLIVLPYKIGDILYEIDNPEYGVIVCKVLWVDAYFGPAGHVEGNEQVNTFVCSIEVIEGHGLGSCYTFGPYDIGRSVFLTREAAEASLRKEPGNA